MKYILYIILLGFLITSCYDDLGNYTYNEELNDVRVVMNKVYGVRKVDTTVVIRPEIIQTNHKDKSNLRYAWTVNTLGNQNRGDTLSTADTLAILIDPLAANFKYKHYIRFYIWDTITGAKQMFPTTLDVGRPYDGSWILQHTQDGVTKLGSVEYIGDQAFVTNDAYYQERGERLKGEAMGLGVRDVDLVANPNWRYSAASVFYCFTDNAEESGILRQDDRFSLYGEVKDLIYPNDYANLNLTDYRYTGEGQGGLLLSGGNAFQGSLYGPRMYGLYPDAQVKGDYNITHAASAPADHLMFDSQGNRFLYCSTQSNFYYEWDFYSWETQAKMTLVRKDPGSIAGINLDNIGDDQEMFHMGVGYWYGSAALSAEWQRMAIYAFTKSKSTDKSYIYEFHAYPLHAAYDPDDIVPLTGYFTITTPAGVTAETPMASSCSYNRIMYYAVDNRVYRLDFGASGGGSTLVYQHPEAGARISVMKMAREAYTATKYDENYGHSPARSLGIVFDLPDGTGEFVVLNLNGSGKVGNNGKFPAIQIYNESDDGQKFGKINDIVFV